MTLEDLPPSAKLVYKVLEYQGPMTPTEIADESLLPRATVSEALGRLDEEGLIADRPSTDDARQTVYAIM